MYSPIQLTNTIPPVRTSLNRSPWRYGFLLSPLALAAVCLALPPQTQATCQEGCGTNNSTFLGESALINNTGVDNTAIGFIALAQNTTGYNNTAVGVYALESNTTGIGNTALGLFALSENTTGFGNTANGEFALEFNSTGSNNTATGVAVLQFNTTGSGNTASGYEALISNTTGGINTANGFVALSSNTTGIANTATGAGALQNNTTGNNNTASGQGALFSNTTGLQNTAGGEDALLNNSTGNSNTASGMSALKNNTTGPSNTATGFNALANNTTGGSNIALGESAGINLTTGSNNIDIGNKGVVAESNTIRIGKKGTQTTTIVAGISGTTVAGGVGVIIDTNGRLGTVVSSARFKNEIKPMDKASEAILALQPVTFHYKHELDPADIPQFGLVAEQVEKVDPDLVAHDEQGNPYTVRYEAVNAMLLNEFLKQHKAFIEEHRKVAELEAALAEQKNQVEVLTAGFQKISAQLETSRFESQTVVSNQ